MSWKGKFHRVIQPNSAAFHRTNNRPSYIPNAQVMAVDLNQIQPAL